MPSTEPLVPSRTEPATSAALEGRIADSATAAMLAGELVTRLEARVAELERLTLRMRTALQQQGEPVW